MKINNTLKQAPGHPMKRPKLPRVTACVTRFVTGCVTGCVTPPTHFNDVVTPIESEGCKKLENPPVTLSVTAFVTGYVTNKKEKNKRKKNSPLHPLKKKKTKKRKNNTHKRACMRKKPTENIWLFARFIVPLQAVT